MRIGCYDLADTVGCGAFSKAKVALDRGTGRTVVVKIVDKVSRQPGKTLEEVRHEVRGEARALGKIRHANVVELFETLESRNHYYLVLEAVRGGDLCDLLLREGVLGAATAARLLGDLCSGIAACHRAGVAHRDIKPDNCLLAVDGSLKVADFGLSRVHATLAPPAALSEDEYSATAVGTPLYAAPEVSHGPYNAYQADYWSIGVVLYVMLFGTFPFAEGGHGHGHADSRVCVPVHADDVPTRVAGGLRGLLPRLLAPVPGERLDAEGVLSHAWLWEGGAGLPSASMGDPLPVGSAREGPALSKPAGGGSPPAGRGEAGGTPNTLPPSPGREVGKTNPALSRIAAWMRDVQGAGASAPA